MAKRNFGEVVSKCSVVVSTNGIHVVASLLYGLVMFKVVLMKTHLPKIFQSMKKPGQKLVLALVKLISRRNHGRSYNI